MLGGQRQGRGARFQGVCVSRLTGASPQGIRLRKERRPSCACLVIGCRTPYASGKGEWEERSPRLERRRGCHEGESRRRSPRASPGVTGDWERTMTFTDAAAEVLRLAGKALHYKEITDLAIEKGLLSHVGKSPEVTMGARLAALLKKDDKSNPIVRVKPGIRAARLVGQEGQARSQGRRHHDPPRRRDGGQRPGGRGRDERTGRRGGAPAGGRR